MRQHRKELARRLKTFISRVVPCYKFLLFEGLCIDVRQPLDGVIREATHFLRGHCFDHSAAFPSRGKREFIVFFVTLEQQERDGYFVLNALLGKGVILIGALFFTEEGRFHCSHFAC